MERLPLFPLPLVLFPGAPLPLHVFEPRYRQMVAHCVEGDGRFGLLYHDPDRHGPFEGGEQRIGCVAEILDFQPFPDGRSLIFTRGRERFMVTDEIEAGSMYHECVAVPYTDLDEADAGLTERRRRSINLFNRVLRETMKISHPLPGVDAAQETAFQLAQTIRVDAGWQQSLLELRSEHERLDRVDALLETIGTPGWKPGPG
jgi:Lon protease-like protein